VKKIGRRGLYDKYFGSRRVGFGSYMCKYLAENGYQSIVLDNLVCGHREAIRWGPFLKIP
jgi:hypothetical protein